MAAEEIRRPHGSGRYVSDLHRGRLLSATFTLVGERGYEGVTARSVSEHAGVSNRTFYECFSDREDCFLAAFNHAVDGLEREVACGLGVGAGLGRAVFVRGWRRCCGRWTGSPRLAGWCLSRRLRRGRGCWRVARVYWRAWRSWSIGGRENAQAPAGLPGLVAEGVVGATFGVIHARLLELRPEPLIELLGSLMATIVLPYRGSEAAARELERPRSAVAVRGGVMAMVCRGFGWVRPRRWITG